MIHFEEVAIFRSPELQDDEISGAAQVFLLRSDELNARAEKAFVRSASFPASQRAP
jgi:hypothetical protein